MNIKSSRWYHWFHDLVEQPWVYNSIQGIVDGGKGRQIKWFLAEVPYRSMIDIGCGTGNWAVFARGAYLGVDSSAAFIERCRKRYRNYPERIFSEADVTTLEVEKRYDLAILVSVLHHLSDDEALRLIDWVARSARYFFVLDLYPVSWNPVSRWLYHMDRGDHVREPQAQKALLLRNPAMRLVKQGSYFCPNGLYRHTLFLFECQGN